MTFAFAFEFDAVSSIGLRLTYAWNRAQERKSPPRLSDLDVILGFATRGELRNGWWERERRVVAPETKPRPHRGDRWSVLQYEAWLCRAVPFATLSFDRSRLIVEQGGAWFACSSRVVSIAMLRHMLLARVCITTIRRRLDEETGYARLVSHEECLDASRVYPPRSIGARFCILAADAWKEAA